MKLNAKGKPFSWSFSAWNDFETCPKKYAAARFYCTSPFQDSEALRWGNRVHKSAEYFLKSTPHDDDEALAPVQKYCEAMMRSGKRRLVELEIALTRDLKPCGWFAKDAWFRGKLDVVLMDFKRTHSIYFDWKSGSKIKENDDQILLCNAALSIVYPSIERFEGKFIWTAHQTVTGVRTVTKEEIPALWEDYLHRVHRMEEAWRTEIFPARKSGLCRKWCDVTECIHCGG